MEHLYARYTAMIVSVMLGLAAAVFSLVRNLS